MQERRLASYCSVWKKNEIETCKREATKIVEELEGNEPENIKNALAKISSILEDRQRQITQLTSEHNDNTLALHMNRWNRWNHEWG